MAVGGACFHRMLPSEGAPPTAPDHRRCCRQHQTPPLPPARAGNKQQQEDELCALRAIYGEEAVAVVDDVSYSFAIPDASGKPHLVGRCAALAALAAPVSPRCWP